MTVPLAVLLALCAAVTGAAELRGVPSGVANAVMSAELASLRAAQDTVKKAELDLDGIDQNSQDVKLMGAKAAIAEHKDAVKVEHPDLGEALMQQDDATPAPELDNDAAVQVEATQSAVQLESASEGEEKADPKDIKKVFDLAKSMRKSDLLPEGWVEKYDAGSGKNYYENSLTKTTSWDAPRSLVEIALTAAQEQVRLKRELEKMKMKMKMRRSGEKDLGESGDVSVHSKCPQTVAQLMKEAKELRATLKSLASKLNLTGEQQKMLTKMMAETPLPEVSPALLEAAKPKKVKPAKTIEVKKGKKGDSQHNDLGESAGVQNWKGTEGPEPVELGEAAALETSDDAAEDKRVEDAMKSEAAKVAKQFADDEKEKEAVARKAAIDAGHTIDKKMAEEDDELFASDKDVNAQMQNIIGDQKGLETEQAMFRGTMTPEQVNDVVDPDIAKMEKEDLMSDNDSYEFKPFKKKPQVMPTPAK